MKLSRVRLAVALASWLSLVVAPVASHAQVIEVGRDNPGRSYLFDIDNVGRAVGYSVFPHADGPHAILWQDGQVLDLGVLPGHHESTAMAINDRGQIVGGSREYERFTSRAVLWDRGRAIDITPAWASSCAANDINARGDIVGGCGMAVLWRDGAAIPLGTLPGFTESVATAVNDGGVVVGVARDGTGRSVPFRWARGTMSALPLPPGATEAMPWDINARGTIVGWATTPAGTEPVIWQGGTVAPLSGRWGSFLGQASGINDRGDVVGTHYGGTGGFVWSKGLFRSLESPLGGAAHAVNERGMAAGYIFSDVADIHGAVWPKADTRVPVHGGVR